MEGREGRLGPEQGWIILVEVHGVGSLNPIVTDVALLLGNIVQNKRRHLGGVVREILGNGKEKKTKSCALVSDAKGMR